jgi:hypothetical protein
LRWRAIDAARREKSARVSGSSDGECSIVGVPAGVEVVAMPLLR